MLMAMVMVDEENGRSFRMCCDEGHTWDVCVVNKGRKEEGNNRRMGT